MEWKDNNLISRFLMADKCFWYKLWIFDLCFCHWLNLFMLSYGTSSHVVFLNCYIYYIIFVDTFIKYSLICFLKQKSHAINTFHQFHKFEQNQFSCSIKVVRNVYSGEYRHLINNLARNGKGKGLNLDNKKNYNRFILLSSTCFFF